MLLFRLVFYPETGSRVIDLTNRLKEFRKRAGLSQEEAAERLGVSHSTVSRHERGLQGFTQDDLRHYADLYKCSPVELISDISLLAQTAAEREVLEALRKLDPADHALALQLLRKMGGGR